MDMLLRRGSEMPICAHGRGGTGELGAGVGRIQGVGGEGGVGTIN